MAGAEDKSCRCSRRAPANCSSTVPAELIMPPCHAAQSSCNSCEDQYCASESSTPNSTPFVSAPSSPKESNCSTPSPHYTLSSNRAALAFPSSLIYDLHTISYAQAELENELSPASSPSCSEFEFSSRFSQSDTWLNPACRRSFIAPHMSTAEELFDNGKIKPLNASVSPSYCLHCCSGHSNACHNGYHTEPELSDPSAVHAENHHQQEHVQQPSVSVMGLSIPLYAPLPRLEQQKKSSMGTYGVFHSRHRDKKHHGKAAMQMASLPLVCDRNIGAGGCRHYGSGGGRHRRARSLSPPRVFHMDDMMMQARASFERENTHRSAQASDHGADLRRAMMRARRSCRNSWTLKELLNMGDRRVQRRTLLQGGLGTNTDLPSFTCADNQAQASQCAIEEASEETGPKEEMDASFQSSEDLPCNTGKRTLAEDQRLNCGKQRTSHHQVTRSPWKLQGCIMVQDHANGSCSAKFGCHMRPEAEAEMRRRILLPHKKGLLGCLGLASKLSCIKGLHAEE